MIAECVDRLDVAMFNGIMRNPEEDSPTDPLADPVTDLSVLPIPVGALTFGAGSQLKNAVRALFSRSCYTDHIICPYQFQTYDRPVSDSAALELLVLLWLRTLLYCH